MSDPYKKAFVDAVTEQLKAAKTAEECGNILLAGILHTLLDIRHVLTTEPIKTE